MRSRFPHALIELSQLLTVMAVAATLVAAALALIDSKSLLHLPLTTARDFAAIAILAACGGIAISWRVANEEKVDELAADAFRFEPAVPSGGEVGLSPAIESLRGHVYENENAFRESLVQRFTVTLEDLLNGRDSRLMIKHSETGEERAPAFDGVPPLAEVAGAVRGEGIEDETAFLREVAQRVVQPRIAVILQNAKRKVTRGEVRRLLRESR